MAQQEPLATAMSGLGPALARIATAYRAEWGRALPARMVRWLTEARLSSTTVQTSGDHVQLAHWLGSRRRTETTVPLATWFASPERALRARLRGDLGLSIPRSEFLVRKLTVPREAIPSLEASLSAELQRQTPMRAADVVQAHVVTALGGSARKAAVEHWIIRNDIVEAQAKQLGVPLDRLAFVSPSNAEGVASATPRLPLKPVVRRGRWAAWLLLVLTCSALIMLGLHGLGTVRRFDAESSKLTAQIATMSERALAVRQQADDGTREHGLVAGLYRQKSETPGLLDIWEEVTRLLPDGTYITELRLAESKPGEWMLHLSGFSSAATSLVALLDRSPLLAETTLSSAITSDPQEQRDRFSVQSRLVRRGSK